MAASRTPIKGSTSANSKAEVEMHTGEEIRFICPNFATDYIPGVLKLPSAFCVENSDSIPERVLLHVPPRVVWKGLYRKDRFRIEGLEKMMSSYSIKPYHPVLFEYRGGEKFYLKIFNPYGVEISYHIENRTEGGVEIDKKLLTMSDFENEKLCGTLAFNAYQSCKGSCDVVVRRRHLRKSAAYNLLEKNACESLGIVESMDWVKLSYKNKSWVVKLNWQNGNLFMDRAWYRFAKAGNMRRGDTIAFQRTDKPQKYMICVFEKDLFGKCNVAGVGHKNAIMDWFKIANLDFISTGEMEIPRVFTQIPGLRIPQSISLQFRHGETMKVNYNSETNVLSGMKKMIRQYSIRATDVMIFSLTNECIFFVSLFKITGMESKYTVANRNAGELVRYLQEEDIINRGDDMNEAVEDVPLQNEANVAVPGNDEVDEGGLPNNEVNFRVTLKPSHVDKKQHGVYLPSSMYPTFKNWSASTVIRLICGGRISMVSLHRSGKCCRFGKGWSKFTKDNNLLEGQVLQLDYVQGLTFEVTIVQ